MNDDHGDQFPGALPAQAATAPRGGDDDRLVRMHAEYVQKVNSVVEAGRDGLAHELAETFAEESSGTHAAGLHLDALRGRRTAGRRTPSRGRSGRRPGQATTVLGRMGRLTRSSFDRFDRYTLDVFNAGAPYRTRTERTHGPDQA
jgi:hypothetical protein